MKFLQNGEASENKIIKKQDNYKNCDMRAMKKMKDMLWWQITVERSLMDTNFWHIMSWGEHFRPVRVIKNGSKRKQPKKKKNAWCFEKEDDVLWLLQSEVKDCQESTNGRLWMP